MAIKVGFECWSTQIRELARQLPYNDFDRWPVSTSQAAVRYLYLIALGSGRPSIPDGTLVRLMTGYGQRKRRNEPRRSPQPAGVKAISGPPNEITGNGLFRGLRISLATGVGAFLVVVHISMYLTGHSFHHGH